MPTPHPPRPPYPPAGGASGESDEDLAARLRGCAGNEVTRPTALLTARHWRQVHQYATICLASRAGHSSTASMVTAAAFHQVLDRLALGEPATALRPRLLVAVRETVRSWAAEDGMTDVLPELRGPSGGRGTGAVWSMTAENRKLVERSFQGLPGAARCLLWHTEVEADPIAVPAALLGMDQPTARIALEQARERFRAGCVRAHRELAPSDACRFHTRLLDIPIRRGGTLLPDVRRHLDTCRHCRFAAEQLGRVDAEPGVLLAEAVLGRGARRYLGTRPPRTPAPSSRHAGARRRVLPRLPRLLGVPSPNGRPPAPRVLLTGVGLVAAGLVVTLVVAGMFSRDDGVAPAASGSAPAPGERSAPGTARLPTAPGRSALRNEAAGLCLDIDGRPRTGASVTLAPCSTALTQQWAYETDGLLRNAAAPDLCLDSHLDAGVVVLGRCKAGDDVRYDITVQGELLPRWDQHLALAGTRGDSGAAIVARLRDGSAAQHWFTPQAATAGPATVTGVALRPPRAAGG